MATSKKDRHAKRTLTMSVMLVLFMFIPALAFANAGKVIFMIGDAQVMAEDGGVVKAHRGMILNSGDTIETGKRGQLQVRMDDGGLIAVRPNSSFRIDEFVNKGDIETDKSFFSLVKGGFRSVTGAVGEANKEAYRVNTPIATIGIRGTDYTARLCDSDCAEDDGLYIGVMSGGVTLTNDVGAVDVDPAEYGYVEGINSDPQLLDSAPGDVLFSKASSDNSIASNNASDNTVVANSDDTVVDKSATTEDGSSINMTTVSSSDDLLVAAVENVVESEPNNTNDSTTETTNDNVSTVDDTVVEEEVPQSVEPEPEIPPAQQYRNVAFTGHTLAPNGGKEVTENVIYAADSSLETIKVTQQGGSVHEFTKEAGVAAVDTGSTSNGEFSWGRWTNMNMTVTDDSGTNVVALNDANSMHWAVGNELENDIVLPTSGTARYDVVGGTTPTDNFGANGVLMAGGSFINVDFDLAAQTGNMQVTVNDLADPDDAIAKYNWELKYDIELAANGSLSGTLTQLNDNGHVSYINGTDPISGTMTGQIGGNMGDGSAPSAAVASYEANTTYNSIYTAQDVDYQIKGVVGAELVSTAP